MSALMNVNVDSTSGRAEVLAFREFVQKNLGSIKFEIKTDNLPTFKMQVDEAAINSSLTAILRETHQLSIDTGSIIKTVQEALKTAFSVEYQVRIASAHLTEQVSAAVKAGMLVGEMGANLPRTNTGALGANMTPAMMAESLRTAILPLADKIDSMTKSTESSMRQGRRTGSVSVSGRADGASVSVKTSIAPDEALALATQAQELAALEKAEKVKERLDAQALAASIAARDAEDAYLRRAGVEQDAWEAARQKERDAAWMQAEKAMEAERQALYRAAFDQEDAALAAHNARMVADDKAARAELLAQQKEMEARAVAETEAFYAQEEAILRAAQAKQKEARAQAQAEADANDRAQVEILKLTLDEQVAAQEAAEAKIKESYKRLKLAAQEQYKGVGPAISAGSQIQSIHGTDAAKSAMGTDSYLLGEVNNLQKYRKAVEDLTPAIDKSSASHMSMTKVMEEAHSAARGLTGALGALWLTWGSLVPMVAGAAIGTGLQQVFSVGKDLEYQLTFVSALSNGAVVNLQQFGDAVRGNLIVPKEAAEGMRALAQNGLDVTDSLKALPDILRLATVGEMSVSDAALGATGVMNAFGMSVDDLGRISDVFAKAAAESNTSVQGMVESMKQASTVSDLYHVSLEETAATLEIMAKRNITGTQAGTAFRKMIEEIATPSTTAKKSIELLGLQFYDSTTKQLKPYSEILTEIKERTQKLNEESKLELLNNIFGERGAKALNAVLSNLDQYNSVLKTLKENSEDFAKSVADRLSESTQGRMKATITDFQLTAAEAFEKAGGSANTFLDTLRAVVDNPEFKQGLTGLANNVAALSQFLLENGRVMAEVGVAYMAFGAIESTITRGMTALVAAYAQSAIAEEALTVSTVSATVALEAEAVAAETTAVAVRGLSGVMAGATFGLSAVLAVVVPLIAEWLIFGDHTDSLTTSIDNNTAALKRQQDSLDQELERLKKSNVELARRKELMAGGLSFDAAKAQAEAESQNSQNSDKRTQLVGDYRQAQAIASEKKRKADENSGFGDNPDVAVKYQVEAQAAQAEANAAYAAIVAFDKQVNDLSERSKLAAVGAVNQGWISVDEKVKAFNAHYAELAASNKKLKDLGLTVPETGTKEELQANLDKSTATLNANLEDKHLPDKDREAREKAETANLIAEIKRRESELTAYYTFRKNLEDALFKGSTDNAQVKAITDAQLEQQHLQDIKEQLATSTARLQAEEGKYPGKTGEAEVEKIRGVIAALKEKAEQLQTNIDRQRVIDKLNGDYADQKGDSAFTAKLGELSAADRKRSGDTTGKFDATIKSAPTAYQTGFRATMDEYSKPIAEQAAALQKQQDALTHIQELMDNVKGSGDSQTDQYQEQLVYQQKLVDKEQERLNLVNAQATAAAQKTGELSQQLYNRAQTAGYGWEKFWSSWSQNATSNAKIVEETLNTTFKGLTDQFANFVTTGKFNFKSLVASILADAARALASKELTSFISLGLSLASDYFGNTQGSDSSGYNGTQNNPSAYVGGGKAGGGQLTANSMHRVNENDPELYSYDGKQFLMAGSKGGRVIPMERAYQGSSAGQQYNNKSTSVGNTNTVSMNINIASDGKADVSTDKTGNSAGELGRMLNNAVLDVLTEQQRPGGRLYEKA
jgi:TP901 family phage tail tape measure protein